MNNLQAPHPTRSTLQNRRLNRAVKAQRLGNPVGLREHSRRSALPKARRQDLAAAITGSLLIVFILLLLML